MSLGRAVFTVGGMTMISRVLGLVREIMIAAMLGAGPIAEAFFVAFRLPNLFRRFFAEGAFNQAFVPMFARRLEGEGPEAAKEFAEQALAGLFSTLLVITLAAQLLMPWLILLIAYGFADDPDKLSLAVLFSRIQFPYLLFMSLTALFSGVLNSLGRFAVAAGAPILLNLIMIGGLGGAWAMGAEPGLWLAWSVFAAGVAQMALVAIAARRAGVALALKRPRWTPQMKRLVQLGGPGVMAGGVTQINILIGTTIATFFDGAVAWLTYADRVYQLPLGVVGVAIGVALLPELSKRIRAGDEAGSARSLSRAIEISLVLTIPAAAALIAIPTEIVALLFGRGAFSADDVQATGIAVAIFSIGLPAYVMIKTLSQPYFAQEDTRSPLRFATLSVVINLVISIGLAPFIGWIAIPIGTAVAAWINTWQLWRGIRAEDCFAVDRTLGRRLALSCVASLVMAGLLASLAMKLEPALAAPGSRTPLTLALVLIGLSVYGALALAFGVIRPETFSALSRRR